LAVPVVMSMIVAVFRAIALMIVTAAVVVIAVPVVAIAVTLVIAVMVATAEYIAWFVFLRSHKIYRPIAGVVFLAVLAPISCVSWWHM
jgi:hypothetical protein